MEEVGFALQRLDIGVDALLAGGELAVLQLERIFPVSPLVVGIYREAGALSQLLPMAKGRGEVAE